jgi:hypothetical protein
MVHLFWFSLLSIWLFQQCHGQPTATPVQVCQLPGDLNESSALIVSSSGLFWSLNDSGGDPILYAFDTTGALVDTIVVTGAINRDWESLAVDQAGGRIFIGDFGNNSQSRQDLCIYWAHWDEDQLTGPLHQMRFTYPDQTAFPAKDNFDCEGFFFWQDSLYLFSKNRTTGAGGFSKLYRLPVDTGLQQAVLVDSILLGAPVTGADIREDGRQIALISYGLLYLIDMQPGQPFTDGTVRLLSIPFSQTEAIAYARHDRVYFTNEQGVLYSLDLSSPTSLPAMDDVSRSRWVPAGPNRWQLIQPEQIAGWSVFDLSGRMVSTSRMSGEDSYIDLSTYPIGQYLVVVTQEDGTAFSGLLETGQ